MDMKAEAFTVDTAQGTIQVSMMSTGQGAWVAARLHNPKPLGTVVTPAQWIRNATQAINLLDIG